MKTKALKTLKTFKYNSKKTEIYCVRCNNWKIVHRANAKYCSDLCRVQDYIDKKELGYTKLILKGNADEMKSLLAKLQSGNLRFQYPHIPKEIEKFMSEIDKEKSNKFDGKEFRIYHIPKNKKKPFELYCKKESKQLFKPITPKQFQNYDIKKK